MNSVIIITTEEECSIKTLTAMLQFKLKKYYVNTFSVVYCTKRASRTVDIVG